MNTSPKATVTDGLERSPQTMHTLVSIDALTSIYPMTSQRKCSIQSGITGRKTEKVGRQGAEHTSQRAAQRELRRMFDHMKPRMNLPFVDEERQAFEQELNDSLGLFGSLV